MQVEYICIVAAEKWVNPQFWPTHFRWSESQYSYSLSNFPQVIFPLLLIHQYRNWLSCGGWNLSCLVTQNFGGHHPNTFMSTNGWWKRTRKQREWQWIFGQSKMSWMKWAEMTQPTPWRMNKRCRELSQECRLCPQMTQCIGKCR